MRLRTALCLTLATVVSLAGCFGDSSEPNANAPLKRPFLGRTIRLVAPPEMAQRPDWQIMLTEWGEQTGADWSLEEWDPHATAGGDSAGTSLPEFDVCVVPTAMLPALAARTPFASIPPELQAAGRLDWLDLFQGLRERVASIDGKPTAAPVSSPVLVCYYRRDLLAKAGLRPPETWDDYRTLVDKLDEWAPGLTVVEPWGEPFRATMFLARAASFAKHPGNYSFYFDISTGEPLIDNPGFVRALEDAVTGMANMPPEVRTYSPVDCRHEFFEGRAALAVTYETGPGNPALPGGSTSKSTADKNTASSENAAGIEAGFVRLPGAREVYNPSAGRWEQPPGQAVNRVTFTGFTGLSVAVSATMPAENVGAAWDLVEMLTVRNRPTAFARAETPCRNSQLADAGRWVGEELARAGRPQEYLAAVADSLRDTQLVPAFPFVGRHRFRGELTAALEGALTGKVPAQDSLAKVAESWRTIASEIGPAEVLNSYRASLGLPPRPAAAFRRGGFQPPRE